MDLAVVADLFLDLDNGNALCLILSYLRPRTGFPRQLSWHRTIQAEK